MFMKCCYLKNSSLFHEGFLKLVPLFSRSGMWCFHQNIAMSVAFSQFKVNPFCICLQDVYQRGRICIPTTQSLLHPLLIFLWTPPDPATLWDWPFLIIPIILSCLCWIKVVSAHPWTSRKLYRYLHCWSLFPTSISSLSSCCQSLDFLPAQG